MLIFSSGPALSRFSRIFRDPRYRAALSLTGSIRRFDSWYSFEERGERGEGGGREGGNLTILAVDIIRVRTIHFVKNVPPAILINSGLRYAKILILLPTID